MTPASAFCQMGAGRRAQHHVQRVHGRVQPRHEDRDGCPYLSQRAFDLAHLECAPLAIQKVDGCEQFLLRLHLPVAVASSHAQRGG